MTLKQLIKERFTLHLRMRWLKEIKRQSEKVDKCKFKYTQSVYCLKALLKEYNERYPDGKFELKVSNDELTSI